MLRMTIVMFLLITSIVVHASTMNYSCDKGYDHTVESIAVSDFYTLITKNTILSKPSENSKLLISLSGQRSFLVNCKLTLDLSDIDFSK